MNDNPTDGSGVAGEVNIRHLHLPGVGRRHGFGSNAADPGQHAVSHIILVQPGVNLDLAD